MMFLQLCLAVSVLSVASAYYWRYPVYPVYPVHPATVAPPTIIQDRVKYNCSCDPCKGSPCWTQEGSIECRIIANDNSDPMLNTDCINNATQVSNPAIPMDGMNPCPIGDPAVRTSGSNVTTATCSSDSDCPPSLMCVTDPGVCCLKVNDCAKIGLCPKTAVTCGKTTCTNDVDCPGIAKCCTTTKCGRRCMYPLTA